MSDTSQVRSFTVPNWRNPGQPEYGTEYRVIRFNNSDPEMVRPYFVLEQKLSDAMGGDRWMSVFDEVGDPYKAQAVAEVVWCAITAEEPATVAK